MDEAAIIEATRRWVAGVVVGLNLCPFARRVVDAGRVRYAVTAAADAEDLRQALTAELRLLAATPAEQVETTLLVHPGVLRDFADYNDFLADADGLLSDLRLRGVIQLAGFHPDYQFGGTAATAVENYTNRSPYPMIHLLREASITAVATHPEALDDIPERNIATLRRLGREKVLALLRAAAGPTG